MLITKLKSKIAYATVTKTELYYVGSITIDADWMREANIVENEQVQVVNLNNGERLETYVITGEAGSGVIAINGPAARKAAIGDQVFILSYAHITPSEVLEPIVVDLQER
jgi:aspartate 1-decarboxylase